MARLRSARLTDGTLVSQIDDFLGELEGDIATIFGFETDEDITVSPFSSDNSGRLTKQLIEWARGHDFPAGLSMAQALQITNSTNSNVVYVGFKGSTLLAGGVGKFFTLGSIPGEVVDPDDSQVFFGFRVDEDDFPIIGSLSSVSGMGLTPKGSGATTEYLCGDSEFRTPGYQRTSAALTYASDQSFGGLGTFVSGAVEVPRWQTETHDDSGLHAANDDEFIIVDAGTYVVGCRVTMVPAAAEAGYLTLRLVRDRGGVDVVFAERIVDTVDLGVNDTAIDIDGIVSCNAADKISVESTYTETDAGTGTFYRLGLGTAETQSFDIARIA